MDAKMYRHRPIVSNRYAQWEDFPSHTRGPNYTRPVFDEYGPYGNFQPAPMMVFPGGRGLNGSEATMQSGGIFGKNQNVLGSVGFFDELFDDGESPGTAEGGTASMNTTPTTTSTAEGGTASAAQYLIDKFSKKTTSAPSTGGGGANKPSNYVSAAPKASMLDNPMTWVVIAAVGAVGIYYVTKKK